MSVSVQEADFDVGAEIAALSAGRPEVGAVASFVGLVRDISEGSAVSAMTLEHYPGMTEQALEDIVASAWAWMTTPGVFMPVQGFSPSRGVLCRSIWGRTGPIRTIFPANHAFGSSFNAWAGKMRKDDAPGSGGDR